MQSSEAFVTLEGQGLAHLGHLCGSPSQLCLESEEGCVRVPGHFPGPGWKPLARRALGREVWHISPQLLPVKAASSDAEGVPGEGWSPRPPVSHLPSTPLDEVGELAFG